MNNSLAGAQSLHHFWFEEIKGQKEYIERRVKIWFGKDQGIDSQVRGNFLPLLEEYEKSGLKKWRSPDGKSLLSLILLLDQVPRNIFRQTAKAHKFDLDALALAKELVDKGDDLDFHPIERVFIYLPFEHSEELECQKVSINKFAQLKTGCPKGIEDFISIAEQMAQLHHEVIDKFGRFPHRNIYLGRESTPEELEFLQDPKYHF